MLILPAIDIKDGQCVRLYQGDYDKVTVFDTDPAAVGRRWRDEGAQFLHLVDLDGAKAGRPVNLATIKAIIEASGLPVEVGGGIRDEATVAELLELGVTRVVLGTIAIKQPDLAERICRQWGERIIIGIDARDGWVATEGWTETSQVSALELARDFTQRGAARFSYTDINRDGTLSQPNYAAITEFIQAAERPVIVGGGVAKAEHVEQLASTGAEAVIIGRALYSGDINLKQVLGDRG